jgi:hypothetical protein
MQHTLRPYVTTGIAIVGASLIAVTPMAPPPPNVQQRALKLVDYTEYDASQLTSATEANWSALESILSSSHWVSDPDISQGLTTLFSDLSTGTSNAVTNPVSLLGEGLLGLLSTDYAGNAASTALTAVTDNVESALSDGNYSLALTDIENGPTTVLYAFLNGYSDSVGSSLISPEFGLLTNTTDGLATGQIDALAQISNTIADEVANLGGANLTTDSLPLLSGNLDLSVSVDQILSDLGLTSGGGPLTINGVLGDLGIPTGTDILPTLTVGDVLGDLGLSDGSGISLGSILSDLNSGSSITVDQILTDLGVISAANPDPSIVPPSIDLDGILSDLGLTNGLNSTITPPSIDLDSILTDLGLSNGLNSTIAPSFDLDSVLSSLGITGGLSTSVIPALSWSSLLGELGINTTGSVSFTLGAGALLGDIASGLSGSVKIDGISIPIGTVFSALESALSSDNTTFSISTSTILSALHIPTTGDVTPAVTLQDVFTDLGVISGSNPDPTITLPSISLDSILTDLGVISGSNPDPTITLPSISLDSILSDLGISGSSPIDLSSILSALGLNSSDEFTIGNLLGALNITDSSTIPLPSLSIDGILGELGINPDENILTLLGISDPLSLSPSIDLDGGPVATYVDDLAKDLLAAVGSIGPVSADLPSLLGTDPAIDLTSTLSSLFTDLDLPVAVSGNLSLDLTSIVAELLPGLF